MTRLVQRMGRVVAAAVVLAGLAAANPAPAVQAEVAPSAHARSVVGEPVSIVLLGTVLLCCAGIIRRRMA